MPDEPRDQEPAESTEPAMNAVERERLPDAQTLSDLDQTGSADDQTGADLEQTAADSDETASERDQVAADPDQVAADDDRAGAVDQGQPPDEGNGYARTRRARSKSARDRESASQIRATTALARDGAATRRDRVAGERDEAARARDDLAATLEHELDRLDVEDGTGGGSSSEGSDARRRAGDRHRAGLGRERAAGQRAAAVRDRVLAAEDRAQAAQDREVAAADLALEGLDDLTGTMLRRVGLGAMQREVDRTRRSGESLVVAYVDVDGLKAVNDSAGHLAGDDLLNDVARSIMHHLRSYDVICRYGGDEFVCSLAGQDARGAHQRFDEIRTRLSNASSGATISVGFAERGEEDGLAELIGRADHELITTRRRPQG